MKYRSGGELCSRSGATTGWIIIWGLRDVLMVHCMTYVH